MQQGTVAKKTDKGFGFIKVDGSPAGGKDLFFHSNELQNVSFDELQEGDKVSFEVGDSPKGPNAINVNKI
ncbi:MAG: cold shock domain-containing protein [Patescibacteria group bacterium]|nr:cold shock domain-containing protein [Patescibacteria group bacterium]MDE1966271.1 cold shock domain-containing protein [Patescibacteria group bacterium]